jgi:hypothetical protein
MTNQIYEMKLQSGKYDHYSDKERDQLFADCEAAAAAQGATIAMVRAVRGMCNEN